MSLILFSRRRRGASIPTSAPDISYAGSPFDWTVGETITPVSPTNIGGASTSWAEVGGTVLADNGLTLNATTGQITGAPTHDMAGLSVTIRATNAGGSDDATIVVGAFALANWTSLGYEDYN